MAANPKGLRLLKNESSVIKCISIMEKNYEAVLIFKETADTSLEQAKKSATEAIKALDMKITGEDEWGKRVLAYDIKGQKEGYYLFYNLKGEPSKIRPLRNKMEVNDDLLRFLVYDKDR